MTSRIFRSICLVALAVFLSCLILIMGVMYEYFSGVQQKQLKMQTSLAAQGVNNEGYDYLDGLETDEFRLTWISPDGTVLYDSQTDSSTMENHLEREEIREAFETGYGESVRYSSTMMERSLYSAKLTQDGSVLRLSISQNTILILVLGMAQPICIVFAVAIILSLFLASRISKKIVKPLNSINLDKPLENDGYDELYPLLHRIDSQQKQLKRQSTELNRRKNELDAIIEEMNEGLVLINKKGTILSINRAAAKLLDTDMHITGDNLFAICRSGDIHEALELAADGHRTEKITELHGEHYHIDASPVISEKSVSGAALLIYNVSEKEKSEEIRREFTANVSHELKTPLHSISGYAELLKNGMVKDDDVAPFSKKIYSEAQRMIQLIDDIINLSHLDEGADDMKREDVDLYTLAENAVSSVENEAQNADVAIELTGETAVVNGISQLLFGMIYNLCDNAVKYNRAGGKVSVDVRSNEDSVILTVSDTGIGIPEEHKERVFERFYRVNKSHSKEVGGTGLGLSIVKHSAMIHNAKITLNSVLNEGTTITVVFPKNN